MDNSQALLAELNLHGKQLVLNATAVVTTGIKVNYVTGDTIGISYNTIPGNNPSKNGDMAAIWQNSGEAIPYGLPPLKVVSLTGTTPTGGITFDKLLVAALPYIIGFGVGAILQGAGQQSYGNICSWVAVPGQAGPYPTFDASLALVFAGPNTVAVSYSLPDNCTPQSNGAWLGIWRSGTPSYTAAPLAAVAVNNNASSATCAFNNLTIQIGQSYTVGLFMSGYNGGNTPPAPNTQTAMAAYVTFTT